jgi:hypothetical protein
MNWCTNENLSIKGESAGAKSDKHKMPPCRVASSDPISILRSGLLEVKKSCKKMEDRATLNRPLIPESGLAL